MKLFGFQVTSAEYQRLKFVIINEMQGGWKPTRNEVKELIISDRNPSNVIQNDMKQLDKLMDHDCN